MQYIKQPYIFQEEYRFMKHIHLAALACIVIIAIAAIPIITDAKSLAAARATAECRDNIDNDGDGLKDYPNDLGCSSRNDNDESNCGDGVCEGVEVCDGCIADCGHCNSCSDSDGGIIISIQGTTSGYLNKVYYAHTDYCTDPSNVMEYYCTGVYEHSQQQSCGTDTYAGSNYCMSGDVYRNYVDYSCSNGTCLNSTTPILQVDCMPGQYCLNGTCLWNNSCSDSDGGWIINVTGTVSGFYQGSSYNYTDFCNSTQVMLEYYCNTTEWRSSPIYCPTYNLTCSNGKCV